MNPIEQYIASGVLELYVAGALSEQENREVAAMCEKHSEVAQEVLRIENALRVLSASTSPGVQKSKAIILPSQGKTRSLWPTYLGWAAATIAAVGLVYMFNQNSQLESELTNAEQVQELLELEMTDLVEAYDVSNSILEELRDPNVSKVGLPGQGDFGDTYAAIFWNKESQSLFVDVNGLPTPPKGMQYQLWSLKLSPLTPTSLGVIEQGSRIDSNFYKINNPNDSEAFGITLEPEGGSEAPNLEQLYVLGTVTP